MAKRKPINIDTVVDDMEDAYVFYGDTSTNNINEAMASINGAVDEYSGSVHASHRTSLQNLGGGGISGRHGLTHDDYERFRPDEASRPKSPKAKMLMADRCYKDHGMIRNIIDLMGDFACQGIRISHPNKRIEKFYQHWFAKVRGKERSERFLNYFFRLGNVVIRVQTASLNKRSKDRLYKTMASIEKAKATPDIDMKDLRRKINGTEIPIKYTFLHPATVDVVGGSLSSFVGDPQYALKIPASLRKKINSPSNDVERQMIAKLPKEVLAAAQTQKHVLLPRNKTRVFHYRKDDWHDWADPMIGGILLDISLYEKLKLADRAALDGAISNIRIFKLGSLDHKIMPTKKATSKLASILESNTNVGTLDLIWGPDIELVESKTNVHQFLGMTKYEPTLLAIYAGVGIPPTLTGSTGSSGTTNNFISLKTFIKRLEYGREAIVEFWNEQIAIVQEKMGFRFPAKVEFDFDDLGDEASEKALLIQLADRDLISSDLLHRRFKFDPEMEAVRIRREAREREKDNVPNKAGPFHDPQLEDALKKVALQTGVVTPSQVGLELEENKDGETPALDRKVKPSGGDESKKGIPQQGRPRNSKDSTKRKEKTFKPKVKAAFEFWASSAQESIDKIMNPFILEKYGKKNMRSMSSEEMDEVEILKFQILSNLEPFTKVTAESVYNSIDSKINHDVVRAYASIKAEVSAEIQRPLSINEKKRVQTITLERFLNG